MSNFAILSKSKTKVHKSISTCYTNDNVCGMYNLFSLTKAEIISKGGAN